MFDYTNWTILAREKHFFKISHNRIKNKQVFKAWNTCPMKQKQSGRNGSRQTSRIFPGFPPDWPFFFFSLSRSYFDVRAGQPCPRCVRGESGPSKSRSSDFCGFFYSPLRPGQREIREPTTAKTRSKVSFLPLRPRIRLHNATVYVSRRTRSYDFFCNESSAFSALIYYALVIWKVNRRNKRYRNRK